MLRSRLTNVPVMGFCLWLLAAVAGAAEPDRPNILFLFADDMCFQTVAAFGHEDIETPHLDRLAQRGATFTHAYNMGGWHGAICVASRTMLNTGRTLWRAEAVDKTCEAERQAGRFWSEHLKRAGYRTYFTGKWHIQAKVQDAFDVVQDVRPGMPATVEASYNRPLEGMPDLWNSADPTLGGYWENGKHLSEITADVAISFLKQAQAQPDPFFMYVAFNAPHDPRQASQEFLDRYPVDAQPVPPNFMPEYPEKDSIGCDPKLRDEKLLPFPRTPYAVQVHRREYFAMITHLDEQIGRIMAALEASGKARNTWVVFTADHGLAVGQHGLVGKQNMYDHSLRVPFIVVGPEVQSGQRISAPIYLQSVLPTTLELAGCEVPEHVDTPVCSRGCGGLLHQLTCRSAGPT